MFDSLSHYVQRVKWIWLDRTIVSVANYWWRSWLMLNSWMENLWYVHFASFFFCFSLLIILMMRIISNIMNDCLMKQTTCQLKLIKFERKYISVSHLHFRIFLFFVCFSLTMFCKLYNILKINVMNEWMLARKL